MRKQNKIVSLVLVVALLLGVFVVIPGSPVVASAAGEGEKFTPTVIEKDILNRVSATNSSTDATAIKNATADSTTNSLSPSGIITTGTPAVFSDHSFYDNGVVPYIVTDVATGNEYLDIRPGSEFDVNRTAHSHVNWITQNTYYAAGTYIITEFDTYTESEIMQDVYVCITSRNSGGSNKAGASTYIKDWALPVGEWAHVTLVGDVDTNTLYVYVNGTLTKTVAGGMYNIDNAASPANGGYFQGIRLNVNTMKNLTANQNFAIDNVTYTFNLESAWLDSNIGATSLVGSGIYDENYVLPSVPALAKVDGETVNSPAELSAKLVGYVAKNVELLRPYRGTITVNCDATVETHGYTAPTAGTNVSSTVNGTVVTYDAPFKPSISETDFGSATNVKNAIVDTNIAGNKIDSIGLSNFGADYTWANGYNTAHIATNTVDGNTYLVVKGNPNYVAESMDSYLNINVVSSTNQYTYDANAPYYTVFEFDFARNGELGSLNMSIMYKYGSAFAYGITPLHDVLNSIPTDEFHRITVIGDNANDTSYVFVDGALQKSVQNGVLNGTSATYKTAGTVATFYGVRFGQDNNQTYNMDNIAVRVLQDSALATVISGGNLSAWSGAITSAKAEYPTFAIVDGEIVNNPAELSAKLVGNNAKKVEIVRPYNGTITVNCDAVIETNGYTVPTAGTNVTVTNDGTVYTYDAPYQQSLVTENLGQHGDQSKNTEIYKAIKGEHADNVFNYFYMSYPNSLDDTAADKGGPLQGAYTYLSTNTIDGNSYLDLKPGASGSNFYLTVSPKQSGGVAIQKGSVNQYYVLDMDVAFHDETVTTNFGWYAVCRDSGGRFATNVNQSASFKSAIASAERGVFHHFTTVLDFDNNYAYVFMNGTLIATVQNGVYGGSGATGYTNGSNEGKTFKFEQFRLFSSNVDNIAVDNIVVRAAKDPSAAAAAITAQSLSGWSENIYGKVACAVLAPLATVDGEYVATAAQLAAALNGRKVKNVEILRDEATAITVNCDAVIETNGLSVNLVAGENVTVTTNGTVKTYDAPWKPSATESTASNGNFIIDASVPGNLFSGRTGVQYINNGDGKMAMYQVTDVETGNTYLKLVPTTDGVTGANIYLTTEIIAAPGNTTADCVLKDGEGYYVYDLDIAADAEIIKELNFAPSARNNASEGSTFPFPEGFNIGDKLGDNDVTGGEWLHLTVVGDMAANKQYLFVNGTLTAEVGKANKEPGKYEYLNVKGYRLNLDVAAVISTDESILVDNIACRVYKSVSETNGLDTALAAGSLTDWTYHVNGIGGEKLPAIATVDGTEYYGATELTEALANGKNHNVIIDRPVAGYVYASSTATVTTNGLANFISGALGYNVVDNGNGTYSVIVENRTADIVVTLNGNEIIRDNVNYGTDIAEYLNEKHSYIDSYSERGAIAADDGTLYYHLTWANKPDGKVDGEKTFEITSATEFTDDYLILENGQIRNGENDLVAFLGWNAGDGRSFDIILNSDMVFSGAPTVNAPNGYKHIYLNGHTLSIGTGNPSEHAMTANNNTNVKIIGGNIVDNVRSNTKSAFYLDYGFCNSFELINCNIYAVANLSEIRGGTLTIKDCSINVFEAQSGFGIKLCEYYNLGYTYNKATLNLVNTDIRFVHANEGITQPFIQVKDFSEWGGVTEEKKAEAIGKGADTLVHEINVTGCTVYTDYSAPFIKSTTQNVNINIDNTQLNAKNVFGANSLGNVTIGNNVLSAVKLSNLGAGIVEVNSGNPVAPYLYTNNYATVIWANGTVERWADGSYPVNANYSKANVPMVEAGNTYNVGDNVTVDIAMKANLSLGANLKLNVYVPTYVNLTAFNVAGVVYSVADAVLVEINGTECYYFGYEMAPHLATGDYTLVATVGETTITKSIDLVDYANLVMAQYSEDANAQNLIKAILNYVAAAGKHMGAYTQGYDAANGYADAAAIAVDTSKAVNTMANVSAYLTGASLDLNAAPAWAFTVANGADISDLVITVNGNNVNYTVVGGKVIVELRAYDMLDTITVEVGGVSGEYNFAAYYAAMKTLADSASFTNSKAGSLIKEAEAYRAMTLLDAFYTYASYAVAYK